MNVKERIEQLRLIADQYEVLVKSGGMVWSDVDVAGLPDGTRHYVKMMLVEPGISFQVGVPMLGGTYLFKLDDPLVGFLHHDTVLGVHQWVDKAFDVGLDNQAVFNYIVARKVDLGILSREAVDKFASIARSCNEVDDERE
jgi:hypothetical protein